MIEGLRSWYNSVLLPVARLLARLKVEPNHLTVCGLFLFIVASYFTFIGYWKWGVCIVFFGACFDGIDGVLARYSNKTSSFGAILDAVSDRFTEILWIASIIAFYLMYKKGSPAAALWGCVAITGALMVSYVKAKAESFSIPCVKGLLQRPERLILLAVFQLLGVRYMVWGLGVLGVLSYITVIQRIYYIWKYTKTHS